jgi:hypothetical protein
VPIVPLFGIGYTSKSPTVTSQKLVNLYREPQRDADKSAMTIYGTPGLTTFATIGTAPARGMRAVGSYLYVVSGASLYRVNAAGAATLLGTLNTGAGRVGMSDNGTQLMIVDGTYGYICTISSGALAQIVDADFVAGYTVTFIAGYFVVDNPSGRFRWCALYDGMAWAALDFATAESNPDALNAVVQSGGELYLLGEVSTEVWAPSGDSAVFRRVGGSGVDWGVAARWSVDKYDGGIIFLAKNRAGESQVVRMLNYTVVPVSGPEENHDVNAYAVSEATGYSYMLDGHSFYQLNFPLKSMLYDGLSQSWSEVSSDSGRHWGEVRAELATIAYVSDYRNSSIYAVDKNVFSDAGTAIVRSVTSRHFFRDYERLSLARLVVDFETGMGLTTGQGSDPQIMLQVSKDNGHTWGNERWTTLGAIGKYGTRAVWRRIGLARDFLFRLKISDPVKVVITGAAVDVS